MSLRLKIEYRKSIFKTYIKIYLKSTDAKRRETQSWIKILAITSIIKKRILSNKDIELVPDGGKKKKKEKESSEHVNRINSINLFTNVVKEVILSDDCSRDWLTKIPSRKKFPTSVCFFLEQMCSIRVLFVSAKISSFSRSCRVWHRFPSSSV